MSEKEILDAAMAEIKKLSDKEKKKRLDSLQELMKAELNKRNFIASKSKKKTDD